MIIFRGGTLGEVPFCPDDNTGGLSLGLGDIRSGFGELLAVSSDDLVLVMILVALSNVASL